MSLLLDALKRAEQEKLAKQGDRPANDPSAPAPPPAAAAPAGAPRREPANAAALELQPMGAAANASAGVSTAKSANAATAQAVFQAKGAASKAPSGRNTPMLWAIGAVIVVAILAIGGYVWWSLSSLQPKITTLRPRAAPTPPPASGIALAPKQETLVPGALAPPTTGAAPATGGTPAPASPSSTPLAPIAPVVTAVPAEPRAAPTEANARPPRNRAELAASLVRDAPPAPTLRLAPTEKARVPVEVAAGYDALRAGELPAARRSYVAAVAADPSSLDAHLGLATVEARLGNLAAAASHYRRALDLDPRNATALTGLASIADMSQPELLEGQLRSDIARYPQSAGLHFALGNLYASRGRWEDAQASYFEALRLEPASADTMYNLAVALDHMGQSRLAADQYRRALESARGQAAQFDPAVAQRRLAELRP